MNFQISEERIVNKLYETAGCTSGEIHTSQETRKQIPGGLKI